MSSFFKAAFLRYLSSFFKAAFNYYLFIDHATFIKDVEKLITIVIYDFGRYHSYVIHLISYYVEPAYRNTLHTACIPIIEIYIVQLR